MLRLFKASFFGALAAAAAPSLFTALMAIFLVAEGELLRAVYTLLLPFGIAAPVVLFSAVTLGLPAHLLLRWTGNQTLKAYTFVGCVLGFLVILVPIVIFVRSFEGGWICAIGALGGGVTARTWWHDMHGHKIP